MSLSAPLMLPPLVVGLALLAFYSIVGMKLGVHTVILAHLVFTQPLVILVVYARMVTFDYAAVDSARDLGASPLRAFFTITLPIIRPTLVGAALIGNVVQRPFPLCRAGDLDSHDHKANFAPPMTTVSSTGT